jgi:hypothetical protein
LWSVTTDKRRLRNDARVLLLAAATVGVTLGFSGCTGSNGPGTTPTGTGGATGATAQGGRTGSGGSTGGGTATGGATGVTGTGGGGTTGPDAGVDAATDRGAPPVDARTGAGGNTGGGTGGLTGAGGAGGSTTVSPCTGLAAATGVFYVDATAGRDSNDGSTPALAWQTLTKVNATTLQPGNAVCFKAGGVWTGQLAPKGSGSATAPIVIDRFGTGNRPRIAAGASDLETVLLLNVQYVEVNNLEVTNTKATPGDLRGIAVRGRDVGVLNHVYIRNCFVHDVSGQVNWIGGAVADNIPPWVTFQTGWDDSKRTGGIVVEVTSTSGTKTWFNDVLIENNQIQDTSFGGIIFKQFDGGFGWGVRSSTTDTKFTPHTNVVLRGNYLSQTNTIYGCNTIYVTGSRHVLIERNVTKDAGTSAIEVYNSDDIRVQYNETFGTVRKANGADFNGIDADRATTAMIIQYNYIHDNGDGILLAQFAFGDSIIRYNLIVNNSRNGVNLHSDSSSNNQTYNNLFFIDGIRTGDLTATSGNADQLVAPYVIRNNIFHSTLAAAQVVTGGGVSYANNLFDGVAALGTTPRTGAAMFVNSAVRPSGGPAGSALSMLTGFQLRAGSPALNSGVAITGNGGVDFWGDPLYNGTPDIGPYEAR